MAPAAGTRLRCALCASEAVVVKANDPEMTCCDQPLEVIFARPAPPAPGS